MRKDWECEIDNVGNEISLLDSCHHINIVNFVKAYLYNGVIWISMEYCDAGTLKQLLQVELDERQISFVIKQVIQGVAYLHKGHRIHRDIKSSNILLNMNGEVKLADLGLCIEGEGEQSGMAGSKYWMAPEMIKRQPYTSKVDIWSIGAVCMEMAEGSPPYGAYKPLKALFLTATKGAPLLRNSEKWSTEFQDFLNQCFQVNPAERADTTDLQAHSFLKKSCEKKEIVKVLKLVFLMRVTAGF